MPNAKQPAVAGVSPQAKPQSQRPREWSQRVLGWASLPIRIVGALATQVWRAWPQDESKAETLVTRPQRSTTELPQERLIGNSPPPSAQAEGVARTALTPARQAAGQGSEVGRDQVSCI